MDKFTKTMVGFVTQTFGKNGKGRFVCTHQEFIAGDICSDLLRTNTPLPKETRQ